MTKRIRSPGHLSISVHRDELTLSDSCSKSPRISPRPSRRRKKLRIEIPVEVGCITPLPLSIALASLTKQSSPTTQGLVAVGVCSRRHYYAISVRKGCRRKMEDTFCALPKLSTNSSNSFFGVFDGHGKEGKRAATLAATQFTKHAESDLFNTDVKKAFQTAYQNTDDTCLQKVEDGGTTATCVYIRGQEKRIWVANVGDSRCVLSRGGVAYDLSNDQKPDRHDEKERIEKIGGQVVFCYGAGGGGWRVEGTLNISRSIGDKKLKNFVYSEPEVHEEQILEETDEFLILATDGLWSVIDSQTAVNIVRKYQSASPAEAAEALSRAALAKKSTDNLCIMVMFFNSPSPTMNIQLPSFVTSLPPPTPRVSPRVSPRVPSSPSPHVSPRVSPHISASVSVSASSPRISAPSPFPSPPPILLPSPKISPHRETKTPQKSPGQKSPIESTELTGLGFGFGFGFGLGLGLGLGLGVEPKIVPRCPPPTPRNRGSEIPKFLFGSPPGSSELRTQDIPLDFRSESGT